MTNQPCFSTPVWRVVGTRAGWLLLLFLAETLTYTVLRTFEDELDTENSFDHSICTLAALGRIAPGEPLDSAAANG